VCGANEKGSNEILKGFDKKGGSRRAWDSAIKDERKSRTSGPNGSNGPLYKHHAETLEVAHKAAATKLAQLEVFIDEQTSMIAQHQAPAPGARP
jgi:hypothetical protein